MKHKHKAGKRAREPAIKMFILIVIVAVLALGASIVQAGTQTDNSGLNMHVWYVSSDQLAEATSLPGCGLPATVVITTQPIAEKKIEIVKKKNEAVTIMATSSGQYLVRSGGIAYTTLTLVSDHKAAMSVASHYTDLVTSHIAMSDTGKKIKPYAARIGGQIYPAEIVTSGNIQEPGLKKMPLNGVVQATIIQTPSTTSFYSGAYYIT